jgi:hypothetical protein
MPQATRSDDHCTYRCYLRGPDGIREFSPCGPGAALKLFLEAWAVNEVSRSGDGLALPGRRGSTSISPLPLQPSQSPGVPNLL